MIVSSGKDSWYRYSAECKITRNGSFLSFSFEDDGVPRSILVVEDSVKDFLKKYPLIKDNGEIMSRVDLSRPASAGTLLREVSNKKSFQEVIKSSRESLSVSICRMIGMFKMFGSWE